MGTPSQGLLKELIEARTAAQVESILRGLPVVDPEDYQWDYGNKRIGKWRRDHLHWIPVGGERGNGGRIKLAGEPINPIAERLVNGMEAIIELERLLELKANASAPMPSSPRDAVRRYFELPSLDSIPRTDRDENRRLLERVNAVRRKLQVRLAFDKRSREFAVLVRDNGMGQAPSRLHETLLSLGQTDKADKPYLIGVFGQGGSSTFAASKYSIIISRRAKEISGSEGNVVGWSIVRQIQPRGRRDVYFAYLAAAENGAVPSVAEVDEKVFPHGSHFCHVKYDFGGAGQQVAQLLYQALNHVLFNPVLPYDLYTIDKEAPELMQGTAQRLARKVTRLGNQIALDKSFAAQPIG